MQRMIKVERLEATKNRATDQYQSVPVRNQTTQQEVSNRQAIKASSVFAATPEH